MSSASFQRLNAHLALPDAYRVPGDAYKVPAKRSWRIRQRKGDGLSESRIQQAVIAWWSGESAVRSLPERLLMAFPLQGRRSRSNGARMKAEGMRAGTPDLFLAVPRGNFHGLWIEMKTPYGKLTPTQKHMQAELGMQGYAAFTCYCYEDAVRLVTGYLDNPEDIF